MAARELARAGKRVTILEARTRCGGRIDPLPAETFGYPAEGGAEFVHGAAPVTRALMREAGLSLSPRAGTRRRLRAGDAGFPRAATATARPRASGHGSPGRRHARTLPRLRPDSRRSRPATGRSGRRSGYAPRGWSPACRRAPVLAPPSGPQHRRRSPRNGLPADGAPITYRTTMNDMAKRGRPRICAWRRIPARRRARPQATMWLRRATVSRPRDKAAAARAPGRAMTNRLARVRTLWGRAAAAQGPAIA